MTKFWFYMLANFDGETRDFSDTLQQNYATTEDWSNILNVEKDVRYNFQEVSKSLGIVKDSSEILQIDLEKKDISPHRIFFF